MLKILFPHLDKNLSNKVNESLIEDFKHTDKVMLIVSIISFLIVISVSAYTNDTYKLGFIGGGVTLVITILAYTMFKGTAIARILFGLSLMQYPTIMVQQQLGMIEMHFGFFILAAFLAMYKDITSLLGAAVIAASYHLLFTYLQLNSVEISGTPVLFFYSGACSWSIAFLHIILWVLEFIGLAYIVISNTKQYLNGKNLELKSKENFEKLQAQQKENEVIINETIAITQEMENGFLSSRITHTTTDENIDKLKSVINRMLDSLNKNIGSDINKLLDVLEHFSKFNFINNIDQNSKLSKALYDVQELITKMLVDNKINGMTLENSAKILLENVQNLSTSSNQAAASLEETAAALEEITSNITNNTDNVIKMASHGNDVKNSVSKGQELAAQTTKAMDEINEEVTSISEAIAVIDQIAFQTNILSLNAAVEAATAGEAGKGFAVVAQEVRNLASRSAEAANEIKQLVENATNKANNGKNIADSMIDGYTHLNESISNTLELISGVEKASKEQLHGIEQINNAITELDQQTQQNASVANTTKDIASQTQAIAVDILKDANEKEFKGKNSIKSKNIDHIKHNSNIKDVVKQKINNSQAKKPIKTNIVKSKSTIKPIKADSSSDEWASF